MAEQKEEAVPAKSKKKLFIIIGAAVGAVIIIAVIVAMMMGGGKGEKGEGGEKGHAAKAEAKAEKKGEGGEKGSGATVYPLEPFIVNIYDGQELRYLKIKVEFEMATAEVKGELDGKQAALRDAVLVLLTTKTMREVQDLQGKNQLRDEILATTGKILGPSKVVKVYFTDFVVQ